MINNDQASTFQQLLENAQTVLIVYKEQNVDMAAAAASLSQGLAEYGKSVTLATPRKSRFANDIPELAKARTEIGNQYLSVSFEYSETAVDKVSYHIGEETGRFYLTIKPKPGEQPLDSSSVEFSYTGVSADLLILVGVQRLEELEQLYVGYEDTYTSVQIVALDAPGAPNPSLSVQSSSTTSQTVAELMSAVQVPVAAESATALLRGIEETTRQFSAQNVTPETFEMVAYLLRQGGERQAKQPQQSQQRQPQRQGGQPTELRPEQKERNQNSQKQKKN